MSDKIINLPETLDDNTIVGILMMLGMNEIAKIKIMNSSRLRTLANRCILKKFNEAIQLNNMKKGEHYIIDVKHASSAPFEIHIGICDYCNKLWWQYYMGHPVYGKYLTTANVLNNCVCKGGRDNLMVMTEFFNGHHVISLYEGNERTYFPLDTILSITKW